MLEPAQIATLGSILGFAIVYVLRERNKWKSEKSNDGHLAGIKDKMATKEQVDEMNKVVVETNGKVGCMDKKLAVVNTNVQNMQKNCEATTERFEKSINGNRGDIKNILAGKK